MEICEWNFCVEGFLCGVDFMLWKFMSEIFVVWKFESGIFVWKFKSGIF